MDPKLITGILSATAIVILAATAGQGAEKQARTADEILTKAERPEYVRKIPANNAPSMGAKDAKVTMLEFIDYCCPFCKSGSANFKDIVHRYDGKVRLVVRNCPMEKHPNAALAARVAMAAYHQGKFWPVHDKLLEWNLSGSAFSNFDGYVPFLKTIPELDVDRLKADLHSAEVDELVQRDRDICKRFGVASTPSTFINGVYVSAPEMYATEIDRQLARL